MLRQGKREEFMTEVNRKRREKGGRERELGY